MLLFGLRVDNLHRPGSQLPLTSYYPSLAEAQAAFEKTMPAASVKATITESGSARSVWIACEGRSDGMAVEWTERERTRA